MKPAIPMRLRHVLLSFLAVITLAPSAAFAARVALVIGNGAYRHTDGLKNPVGDAKAVAQALGAAGFTVRLVLDADLKAMKEAVRNFKTQVQGGDDAVFYYSGHGVELDSVNYLLPIDITGRSGDQVKDDSLPLQRVLDDLYARRARFTMAIIDACRDNPFRGEGKNLTEGGLAPTNPATGQMVLYAAGARQKALDRLGENDPIPYGVFTRVLLEELRQPGVPADRVLRNVREKVVSLALSIGHEQVPALYDQSLGSFYFHPPASGQALANLQVRPEPAVPSAAQQEEEAWKAVLSADKLAGYEAYLQEYPKGRYASTARIKIAALRQAAQPPAPPTLPARPRDECADCPEMVSIPAGSFTMGSPVGEAGRDKDEGPQHAVRIVTFELARHEVTVGEFRRFVRETGYRSKTSGCTVRRTDGSPEWKEGRTWDNPGFKQSERHPVVCVSWDDAQAYISWLNGKADRRYRLPSEAEWEYAARAGSQDMYPWGEDPDHFCRYGNTSDKSAKRRFREWDAGSCDDGNVFTAAIGSYQSNNFGLKDMLGNAGEWVEDCYENNYEGAPSDGQARIGHPLCSTRVVRGGSWITRRMASAGRIPDRSYSAVDDTGFRLARTLP